MKKLAVPMCTCHAKSPYNTDLKETQLDEDGVCNKCGYYVVWVSKYQLYPKCWSIGGYSAVVNRPVTGFTASQFRAYKNGNRYEDPFGDSLDIDLKELVKEEL